MELFYERKLCPVCQSADTEQILSEPYVGGGPERILRPKYDRIPREETYQARLSGYDYSILSCLHCRALFQKLAPTPAFAAEYYGSWIAQHGSPKFPFGEYAHAINEALILTDFLLKWTGKAVPAELKILDFGVGMGVFANAMKACGCRVFGFDLSDERVEARAKDGILPVGYDAIEGFDFINTEQVFEHLPDPLEKAKHLTKGLCEKGVLKISVPFARWLERGPVRIDWSAGRYDRNSYMPLQPLEHLTYFRRPSLVRMMGRLGFEPVRPRIIDELNYAFDWKRSALKNLARPFIRTRLRNYYLFARPD